MQRWLYSFFGTPAGLSNGLRGFVIGAVLVVVALVSGWILGLLARAIFMRAFSHSVEELSRRLGYKQLEQTFRLHLSLGTLVGWAVQVIVTVVALLLFVSLYYPTTVEALLLQGIVLLPTLLIALTLVLVGLFLSQILADLTFTAARAAKRTDATTLSLIVRVAVLFLAVAAALLQLGVATIFVTALLVATLATGTLTLSLAAGIGGADYVRGMLAGRAIRAQLHPGQRVAIDDVSGIVIECGPSATLIASDDGKRTLVPNKIIAQKSVVLG